MAFVIPEVLAESCRTAHNGAAWLKELPQIVAELERRWGVTLGPPVTEEAGWCSWVAPATRGDGSPAILKVARPHMEGDDEISGLRFYGGGPMVELLEADTRLNAMLLERCEPGTPLWERPDSEQDAVLAGLLHALWRPPPAQPVFRTLAFMTRHWSEVARTRAEQWPDAGIVELGLQLFRDLPTTASQAVMLHTDLHPGNVLRAQREPWLAIDPKPFIGDPAYDATQHLLNCEERMRSDPEGTIARFADLLGVEREQVRLWTFARAAAQPRNDWKQHPWQGLAEALAP